MKMREQAKNAGEQLSEGVSPAEKKRTGAGAGVSGFASRQFSGIMGGGGGSEMDRSVYLFQPVRVGKTFVTLLTEQNLLRHIGITVYETGISFLLVSALGMAFAVLLWLFPRFSA